MPTEQSIIDDLIRAYGQPRFRERSFHAYRAAPRVVRMFLAMRIMETETINGGLAQFLWSAFYHWRPITADCAFAYAAIGAQPQAAAMPEVVRLLAAHEAACGAHAARAAATQSLSEFEAWYAVGEPAMRSPVESLFYHSGTLDALRQSWLTSHVGGRA